MNNDSKQRSIGWLLLKNIDDPNMFAFGNDFM